MLSFASGSARKRITAGVKARQLQFPAKAFDLLGRAFALRSPPDAYSFKRILAGFVIAGREPPVPKLLPETSDLE
jgi:hypothetical protein